MTHINLIFESTFEAKLLLVLKNFDFVFFGNQAWDTPIGSNCKDIAREVARNNRVLYVNRPLDRITLWRKQAKDQDLITSRLAVIDGRQAQVQAVADNLYTFDLPAVVESINWLPPGPLHDYFLRRNARKIFDSLSKSLAELQFERPIFFNDSEMFTGFHAPDMLPPALFTYYSRDNLISTDYFKKHGRKYEPALLKRYDLALANSLYLKDYCAQYQSQSHYVGQGCDLSIFNPEAEYPLPEDLRNIPGPIIGYIGALLALRLDINLLEELAAKRPEWSIVLVGPEDEAFRHSRLHRLPNVYFLGAKKPEELGAYLAPFDVAINPQELNPMTIGNYPRKIDEYLALGKATVATHTRAMESFADQVYLATDLESWEKAIDRALSENNDQRRQARMALAKSHSWPAAVEEIYRVLEPAWQQKFMGA